MRQADQTGPSHYHDLLVLYDKGISQDVNLVSFVGNGSTIDLGFSALYGAVKRSFTG